MKILSIIFAFLTITLSSVPCVDGAGVDDRETSSVSQNSQDQNHAGFDVCSPFCSCVCCASTMLQSLPQKVDANFSPPVFCKKEVPFYISSFPKGNGSPLFQPPKV